MSTIINNFVPSDITTNFSGNMMIVSNCMSNSNTGIVNIYNYNEVSNTWSSPVILNGPFTNSFFGQSIDVDWDGTRIAVGANAAANVYLYDYDASISTWVNSNVIQSAIGSDFGYSLSISKDTGEILAVGAPQHNNVYIYEMTSENVWTVSNVLNGSQIQNIIGYDASQNLILNSNYNRYGENIKLSGFGDYIVVGQPGALLSNIFSADATNFQIVDSGQKEVDGSVSMAGLYTYEYYNYFYYPMFRQEGSVQVFKTNDKWQLSNTQVGSTLYGERNCLITDASRYGSGGWSPSGFGLNVKISLDGSLIAIGAPLFSINGGEYEIHNGKIYTYYYDSINQGWELKNDTTGDRQGLYGLSFDLDYEGTRIATVPRNNRFGASLNVLDWNGTDWYDVTPAQYFYNILSYKDFSKLVITNGKIVYLYENNKITKYNFTLTQNFEGNSLFYGYISTPQLFVGTNDADLTSDTVTPAKSKVISFGGSYGENTYNSTTIENRVYESYDGQYNTAGRSELLLAKTNQYPIPNQVGGGIDFIRLKANEIRLDYHESGADTKYERTSVFVCNYRGSIGIKIPETPIDTYFRSVTRTKADMDINGSVFVRNKLTLCDSSRSNIISNDSFPVIIWDTRKPNTVQGTKVYSNIFGNYEITDRSATMTGGVAYSTPDYAFYFQDSTGKIETDHKDQFLGSGISEINFWIKLTAVQSSISGSERIATIGDLTTSKNVSVNMTSSNIEVNYGNGACVFSNTMNFNTGVWYHVNTLFTQNATTPTTSDTLLRINNSLVTLVQTGTTTSDYDMTNGNVHFTLGSGIREAYVGMISFGLNNHRFPQSSDWYNNGPPDELLAVGGGATFSGKMGIGITNPTEALDVLGNVTVSGHMTSASPKFYAYNQTIGATTSSVGVVNIFSNTRVNVGSHYNIQFSRFVAPVAGTYEFKFVGMHNYVSSSGYCELSFSKNGTNINGISKSYTSSNPIQNIAEVMINLQTGDYVEPYIFSITPGTTFEYGGNLGFFSGKLLG